LSKDFIFVLEPFRIARHHFIRIIRT